MNRRDAGRFGASLTLLSAFALAGCQATAPPMTEAERTEIADTITRLAGSIDDKVDHATCLAQLAIFGGQEPVVAAMGGVFRTAEDLKPMCPDGLEVPNRFDIEGTDTHVLSRDHAYIVRHGILTFTLPNGPERRVRYAATDIFVRMGQEWKMAHHHESSRPMNVSQ
jgi:hypothetical protein